MKICAISDLHGNLNVEINPCNITLICGDITPLKIQKDIKFTAEWFKEIFIPWCNKISCDKVIFIGGNHDKALYKQPQIIRNFLKDQTKIIYLDRGLYTYNGITIYGTPWCKPFGNWYFLKPIDEQILMYEKEFLTNPLKVDILITHDAPYGISDLLLQDLPWTSKEHIGNSAINKLIELLQPQVALHGHLHSSNHEVEYINETAIYNVSLLDENYRMVYKPLYLEINPQN